jgi:hypothetical protein
MKNLFGLLLAALVLVSCNKDDDGSTNASVEGNWKLTSLTTENAYDLNEDGNASNNLMTETGCYQNETITFSGNGTGTATSNSYALISVELVVGTTDEYEYTIECIQEVDVTAFTWTQSGSTITVSVGGASSSATLSGSDLTIVVESGFDQEVEGGNGTVTVMEDLTFVYTKQ